MEHKKGKFRFAFALLMTIPPEAIVVAPAIGLVIFSDFTGKTYRQHVHINLNSHEQGNGQQEMPILE